MFEKTKEAQTASLSDLQSELKSLKSLLVSRNASSGSASLAIPRSYSPFNAASNQINGSENANGTSSPSFQTSKPSIPAWQLASTNDSASSASSPKAPATAEDSKTQGYTVDSSPPSSATATPLISS
jgi:peroxin-14